MSEPLYGVMHNLSNGVPSSSCCSAVVRVMAPSSGIHSLDTERQKRAVSFLGRRYGPSPEHTSLPHNLLEAFNAGAFQTTRAAACSRRGTKNDIPALCVKFNTAACVSVFRRPGIQYKEDCVSTRGTLITRRGATNDTNIHEQTDRDKGLKQERARMRENSDNHLPCKAPAAEKTQRKPCRHDFRIW